MCAMCAKYGSNCATHAWVKDNWWSNEGTWVYKCAVQDCAHLVALDPGEKPIEDQLSIGELKGL